MNLTITFLRPIYRFIKLMFLQLGYRLTITRNYRPTDRHGLNLNIGSAGYLIDGFRNLDFYSKHYYPSKKFFERLCLPYDIRKQAIPFMNNSVRNIYISHVIEHIEDAYVENFFIEAYRVLEVGGVLRIVCPDSKFLHEVSSFSNSYFAWHHDYNNGATQLDMLIDEIAFPRLGLPNYGLENTGDIFLIEYIELINKLKAGMVFDELHPGRHINNWDFEKIKFLGNKIGFSKIINSKSGGSVSADMQGSDFDLSHRAMSLYVDLVK